MTTDTKIETPDEAMTALGLTVESVFVPWSQSRNKDKKDERGNPIMSLNWKVTIKRDGREITTTDYSAGVGHCPAYKASIKDLGGQNCIMRDDAIRGEVESGVPWTETRFGQKKRPSIMPGAKDVIASLVMDSSVLDESSFEDWASNLGYDTDSRKAESIYRACLDLALKLRNGLGEAGLARLRDAFRDY